MKGKDLVLSLSVCAVIDLRSSVHQQRRGKYQINRQTWKKMMKLRSLASQNANH